MLDDAEFLTSRGYRFFRNPRVLKPNGSDYIPLKDEQEAFDRIRAKFPVYRLV